MFHLCVVYFFKIVSEEIIQRAHCDPLRHFEGLKGSNHFGLGSNNIYGFGAAELLRWRAEFFYFEFDDRHLTHFGLIGFGERIGSKVVVVVHGGDSEV